MYLAGIGPPPVDPFGFLLSFLPLFGSGITSLDLGMCPIHKQYYQVLSVSHYNLQSVYDKQCKLSIGNLFRFADLMSLKKFMPIFVLRMNDDPDTHCEPVSSQQVQKSLKLKGVIRQVEAKRYHQASQQVRKSLKLKGIIRQGFLVKHGSHYQLMSNQLLVPLLM